MSSRKPPKIVFVIACLIIVFQSGSNAIETVFPEGYDFTVSYTLSAPQITVVDTLTVNRIISNNEGFSLASLYLADNLPPEFVIIDFGLSIDGQSAPTYFSGAQPHSELPGYNTYIWLIDHPPPDDSANSPLLPGRTLSLAYKIICQSPGDYILPFHTICGYGDNTGIFSVAEAISIEVMPWVDIGHIGVPVPNKIFTALAFPNPFNSEVVISLISNRIPRTPARLVIYSLTGGIVYEEMSFNKNEFLWRPQKGFASGNYYYIISHANNIFKGKVTLLK